MSSEIQFSKLTQARIAGGRYGMSEAARGLVMGRQPRLREDRNPN